jgi:hypothetical protein
MMRKGPFDGYNHRCAWGKPAVWVH